MKYDEAKLYLEHTSYDDFNLEEHQINNRLEAIKIVLEENAELKRQLQLRDDGFNAENEELCEYAEKYSERRDLVKYRNNLKEINRLISTHDNLIRLYKEKIKIEQKIKSLEEELKEQI